MNFSDEREDSPYFIETSSGKFFNLKNPTSDMVDLSDIETGLFNIIRFSGQAAKKFTILPSVALHCCLVDDILQETFIKTFSAKELAHLRLDGLLHDAHEAYIGDISTPLKRLIGLDTIKSIESAIDEAIYEHFGLSRNINSMLPVKQADMLSLRVEASTYLRSHGSWAGNPLDEEIMFWQNELMQYLFDYRKIDWKSRVLECLETINMSEVA